MSASSASLEPMVFVIDDDGASCRAVAELVRTFGQQVQPFQSPLEFVERLSRFDENQVGCVVSDLRMPAYDGMELQQQLRDRGVPWPVIFITAYADTSMTVRAMRRGALAVLDKPFREDELWRFVQEGLAQSEVEIGRNRRQRELADRFKRLSQQDRQVLQFMLQGCKNRLMAQRLDVSLRTVENRRRRVFDLMEADSVAELARSVVEYEHNLPASADDASWLALPVERAG